MPRRQGIRRTSQAHSLQTGGAAETPSPKPPAAGKKKKKSGAKRPRAFLKTGGTGGPDPAEATFSRRCKNLPLFIWRITRGAKGARFHNGAFCVGFSVRACPNPAFIATTPPHPLPFFGISFTPAITEEEERRRCLPELKTGAMFRTETPEDET